MQRIQAEAPGAVSSNPELLRAAGQALAWVLPPGAVPAAEVVSLVESASRVAGVGTPEKAASALLQVKSQATQLVQLRRDVSLPQAFQMMVELTCGSGNDKFTPQEALDLLTQRRPLSDAGERLDAWLGYQFDNAWVAAQGKDRPTNGWWPPRASHFPVETVSDDFLGTVRGFALRRTALNSGDRQLVFLSFKADGQVLHRRSAHEVQNTQVRLPASILYLLKKGEALPGQNAPYPRAAQPAPDAFARPAVVSTPTVARAPELPPTFAPGSAARGTAIQTARMWRTLELQHGSPSTSFAVWPGTTQTLQGTTSRVRAEYATQRVTEDRDLIASPERFTLGVLPGQDPKAPRLQARVNLNPHDTGKAVDVTLHYMGQFPIGARNTPCEMWFTPFVDPATLVELGRSIDPQDPPLWSLVVYNPVGNTDPSRLMFSLQAAVSIEGSPQAPIAVHSVSTSHFDFQNSANLWR